MRKEYGRLNDPIDALPPSRIRELLDYNDQTGIFTWRERPVRLGPDVSRDKGWNNRFAGKTAGYINKAGYVLIRVCPTIHTPLSVLAHRLAWAYFYEEWPKGQLDHRNRVRDDNRIANLRLATVSQNMTNTTLRKGNRSGVKGVSFQTARGKWRARLNVNGQQVFYGYFATKEEAVRSRLEAARRFFGDFACEDHD